MGLPQIGKTSTGEGLSKSMKKGDSAPDYVSTIIEEHIKAWLKNGGTREDYLRIAALDGNLINGITWDDISIYETMPKKSSNGLVSEQNTKLLLEKKKELEASSIQQGTTLNLKI